MKYYLIAGEASGDLHASRLITSLIAEDADAEFRFFGGDKMLAAASGRGTLVRHYRDLAYMGFIPVLLHLRTIMNGMKQCRQDISQWKPDVVILVDYAGFNLKMAKYIKQSGLHTKVCYYISPKIWAWKEYRIKDFKRYVDEMFCILPFEKEFFEQKHQYPVHYVGNPTAEEVRTFIAEAHKDNEAFLRDNALSEEKPIVALLAGSRQQEIKDNLPAMLEATKDFAGRCQLVIAGAPAIDSEYYGRFTKGYDVKLLGRGQTYQLLYNAAAALVTSGTATLETALFKVPQVVCYKTPLPWLMRWGFDHVIKCKYISLVNLIADREVVRELFADRFSVGNIHAELGRLLDDESVKSRMLKDYDDVDSRLSEGNAPANTARIISSMLKDK